MSIVRRAGCVGGLRVSLRVSQLINPQVSRQAGRHFGLRVDLGLASRVALLGALPGALQVALHVALLVSLLVVTRTAVAAPEVSPPPAVAGRGAVPVLLPIAGAAGASAGVELHGHRGARGLAPENTLAGFRRALEVGVDVLELDVGLSADGIAVVSHDSRLNPALTRDAQGRWLDEPTPALRSLPLAELARFDVGRLRPGTRYAGGFPDQQPVDGERLPTLAQVLALGRAAGAGHVRFNVETKISPLAPELTAGPEAMADAVLDAIERAGLAERCIVQSFDWRTLARVHRRAPGVLTAALTAEQRWLNNVADPRWTAGLALAEQGGSVPRLVKASGAAIWSPYFGDLTPERLAEARALGLRVVVWTVNGPADIERMLDWGVDGIISDRPDLVRGAMARRGLPLPAASPRPPG